MRLNSKFFNSLELSSLTTLYLFEFEIINYISFFIVHPAVIAPETSSKLYYRSGFVIVDLSRWSIMRMAILYSILGWI